MSPVENPVSLIKSTIDNFQIEPDIATLDRINENLQSLKNKRLDTIDEQKETLKSLTRKYEELKVSLTQQENSESRYQLKKQLSELELNKFELAKNLTDLEINLNQLNTNFQNLVIQLNDLNMQNDRIVENDYVENYDSIVLKLKLFKKMGIIINFNEDDQNDKIIVYNKEKDTTNVLKIDDQYSSYFISNYIWERI